MVFKKLRQKFSRSLKTQLYLKTNLFSINPINLVLLNQTQLSIVKPNSKHSRVSTEFPNQHFIQIGRGVYEL